MNQTIIFVCTTCGAKDGKISAGNGQAVLTALHNELMGDAGITVRAVTCLSNCDRGVSVALTAPEKFSWVFGEQSEQPNSIAALTHAARIYHDVPDGFLAKIDRAQPVIGRVPPSSWTL